MGHGPAIMICVGATKAGTSWIHDQVAAHPDCDFRSIKELHYFDAIRDCQQSARIAEFKAEKARLKQKLVTASVGKQMELQRRIADLRDWISVLSQPQEDRDAYCRYLTAGRADQALVGEATPAYAALPVAKLRQIAGMAEDVRMVYLMRDPVARLWSHVRMLARRETRDPERFARLAAAKLDAMLARDPLMSQRGDYAGVLAKLQAAVPAERLLAMFSEDLMTPTGMGQVWRFLGLDPVAVDFSRRVHEGIALAMTQEQRARARAALLPQYEFAAQEFRVLPEAWRRSMEGVAA